MIGYYDLTTVLKTALLEDEFVNTVTKGKTDRIDIIKQTLFPLAHVRVENVNHESPALRFSISIELLDILDINNDQTNDRFSYNDNEDDILNTQLAVGLRLVERFRRGDLFTDDYQLDGEPNYEPIHNEYENGLSGWRLTLDILYNHEMTICGVEAPSVFCSPVVVENSDGSYSVSVPSGDTLILPDDTFNIYVNGVLDSTQIVPSLKDSTFNISA